MPTLRRVAAAALLPAEVLLLTLNFEPAQSGSNASWLALAISNLAIVPRLAIAFIATLALMLSPRASQVRRWFVEASPRHGIEWLALNLVAFALLYQQTARLFGQPLESASPGLALAWMLLCATVAVSWSLLIASAQGWHAFAREHREALLLSTAGAFVTWILTVVAQRAWRPLADATLMLAKPMVAAFYPDVAYDAVRRQLGTSRILVDIAPECSGYEGLALVTVFVGLYMALFRDRLVLRRVLWLFPVAWIAIWLANVVRIAAIVVIGTGVSPAIATQAFHSQAGWIAFSAIGLAIVGLGHRSGLFLSDPNDRVLRDAGNHASSPSSAPSLLVPWMVLMAASMVSAAFASDIEVLYPLPVIVTAWALWAFRRTYTTLPWAFTWEPVAIGVAVFAMWIALSLPLADKPMPQTLRDWPVGLALAWIAMRIAGSVIVVPIVEELAFRGYLLRRLVDREFDQPGTLRFTPLSFAVSSLLFGLMHRNWLAGTLAGAAFAWAAYRRGRIFDAIVAHAVANALIAASVLGLGWWSLW